MPPILYKFIPIPPIEEQPEYIDAGAVKFGVEYRVLGPDEIAKFAPTMPPGATSDAPPRAALPDDAGVSIHVFDNTGDQPVERLRFDCFNDEPHYHYLAPADTFNEYWDLDPTVTGEPIPWALRCIESRLPEMLSHARAVELAGKVDMAAIAAALPAVAKATEKAQAIGQRQAAKR